MTPAASNQVRRRLALTVDGALKMAGGNDTNWLPSDEETRKMWTRVNEIWESVWSRLCASVMLIAGRLLRDALAAVLKISWRCAIG